MAQKKLVLNSAWCKGCGICEAFCPKQVLKLENGKITITVTNTKDNTSQIYENVSEEDASDPSKFIKEEVDDDEDEDDEEEDKGE